jgi:uncharacterized membrane protein YhdT
MNSSSVKSAIADVLLLSSPLLICLIVFAFFGDNWKNFMAIPEWSFLSAFLFIETLKEAQSQKRNTTEEITDGRSAICTYSVLILIASTIMVLAFANSRGYLADSIQFNEFSIVQPILLVAAVILTLKVKYQTRALEAKPSQRV